METRKIIAFGKSTFSITLPKKWIVSNKLKKGDTVSVEQISLGKLEIIPSSRKGKQKVKKIAININNRPMKEIQREVIAAYIKGYSVIDLVGDHSGKVSELRRRLHELIAMEIMEVTHNRITTNVFFDVSIVSLPKIISRVEIITKTILDEAQSILRESDNLEVKYRELMEKKREVDRQSLFAIRIIVTALTDPIFATQIEAGPLKLSFVWHMIEHMEKISDYLLSIAFYMTSTDVLENLEKKGKEELYDVFSSVGKTYDIALRSYNKSSLALANEVFDSHTKNDRSLHTIHYKYHNRWIPVITGYLRRLSSKSRDIAKITINVNTK